MFFEWLGREGAGILSWWLLTSLAGVAVFPLFFRLMGGLPSRGYPLARTAGLMLVTFVFWLLNILQLLRNDAGSVMLAWFIVFCVGLFSYATWPERTSMWQWFKQNRGMILTTELLFVGLFLGWATVRALNPNLTGTEKPMEMAFLSAIRRSATFPPNDPWMSGYAISYYHFGYIMAATLAKLSDVTNGAAFNLMASLVFSLAGTGIFGVVFDLVASRLTENVLARRTNASAGKHKTDEEMASELELKPPSRLPAIAAGLIGTFFLVLMGNFGTTLIEVPYQAGLIPQGSPYLQLFDLRFRDADFTDCPPSDNLDPNTWCRGWWWWAYSRVVQDVNPDGGKNEIITEMPIFSFVLSDIHPHVLSLPFTLLVIGLGFNMVVVKRRPGRWEMLLYGVLVGGMIFLNSWDAVYLALFVGADALRRLVRNGTGWFTNEDWRGMIGFALTLLGLTALLYSPFFISFRSQAAGILPNVIWPTRFPQFLIMFTPFLLIIAGFLWVETRRGGATLWFPTKFGNNSQEEAQVGNRMNWPLARQLVMYGVSVIVLFFIGFAVIAWLRPDIAYIVYRQTDSISTVILDVIRRRIFDGLLTQATLVIILFVVIARLFAREPRTPDEDNRIINYSPATGYALLLIAAGAVLALVPEFVYLRDGFGTRINMIFKLWYQAWTLWSVGCAFAVWAILAQLDLRPVFSPRFRQAFAAMVVFLLAAGAVFPAAAVTTRAFRDGGHLGSESVPLTLDGGPSLAAGVDDYTVIQCLASVARDPNDVVAEATRAGLAYAWQFGRVSGLTGIPTLMGWDNHERQWRGDTFDDAANTPLATGGFESRFDAVATLYNTTDWNAALDIINRYHITYVYVGPTERNERRPDQSDWLFSRDGLAKFDALPPVCKSGDVAVYSVDSIRAQVTQQQTGG
jgi:YYY domain-containing protein